MATSDAASAYSWSNSERSDNTSSSNVDEVVGGSSNMAASDDTTSDADVGIVQADTQSMLIKLVGH